MNNRVRRDTENNSDEEYWKRNSYLASPCFINVIEKQFGKRERQFSLEELAQLYPIWEDGYSLGRYDESAKDAEGT